MNGREDDRRQSEQLSARGYREEQRDHDLTLLDEREVRERMREAQERFVRVGLAVYLIAVQGRRGIEYSLELHEDSATQVPMRELQEIADDLALELHYTGSEVLVEARPRPNWSVEDG